mmetsp:Transcript_22471/g.27704  ORF Transcript_22471/g.27704 Transcript_22471/m.27704 type:complete len:92 (+) Transcript_22471:553-828(+)
MSIQLENCLLTKRFKNIRRRAPPQSAGASSSYPAVSPQPFDKPFDSVYYKLGETEMTQDQIERLNDACYESAVKEYDHVSPDVYAKCMVEG